MNLLLELEAETEDGYMVSRMKYADITGISDADLPNYLAATVRGMQAQLEKNLAHLEVVRKPK